VLLSQAMLITNAILALVAVIAGGKRKKALVSN
jgi:hypothetical protein